MEKDCINCSHSFVCFRRQMALRAFTNPSGLITQDDFRYICADYEPRASVVFKKTVNQATDEIYGSVEEAATGNYWFSEYWNLFCEKEQYAGNRYFVLKLERYGDSEECQDFEFDTDETITDTEDELRSAIERIIKRNKFLIEEVLTK